MSEIVNGGSDAVLGAPDPVFDQSDPIEEPALARATREGLPPSYRMRADRHYVEQLTTREAGQPVRMLAVDELESLILFNEAALRPLVESVRIYGIVQPLLVRRQGPRYSVVAGHRRLAAARLLRLAVVPCLVLEVDDERAAALAAADNLTIGAGAATADPAALAGSIRQVVASHLQTVRACADLVAAGTPSMTRSVFDLIRAHAWRAARLIDALDLITSAAAPPGRDRRLSSVVDEVIEGFGAESRLNEFRIEAQIADETSSSGLNDHELTAGLSAAVMATLPLVEHAAQPVLLVTAAPAGHGSVVVAVAQAAAVVPPELARRFFDEDTAGLRPGGWAALAGALATRALAARYHGTAALDVAPQCGSTLRIELVRRS